MSFFVLKLCMLSESSNNAIVLGANGVQNLPRIVEIFAETISQEALEFNLEEDPTDAGNPTNGSMNGHDVDRKASLVEDNRLQSRVLSILMRIQVCYSFLLNLE